MTGMVYSHLPLIFSLLLAGSAAGFLAGLFGIGGGIVLVPALFSALTVHGYPHDMAMHVAVGTSLATIILTGLSSALAHWRRGGVDRRALRALAPSTALGAGVGAGVASVVGGSILTLMFAVFSCFMAWLMLNGEKGFALVHRLPEGPGRHLLGGGIGLLSAMLGIGGGTLSVPTLVACGYAMPVAAGTGAALGLAIAGPGAFGAMVAGWGEAGLPPFSLGYVCFLAVALIAPFSALLAPAGARLSHALPEMWLRRGFSVLLILIAGRMLWKVL